MNRYLSLAAVMVAWSVQAAELPVQTPATAAAAAAAVEATAAAPALPPAQVPAQPHAPGIETPGYKWNDIKGDQLEALKAAGDPVRGADAYIVCQGCHGADALGDAAGYYPRLAGQYTTVLIKQLTDVREGRRDNPKEFPFSSEHVITPQDIADIAAYLHGLPAPAQHGQGPGGDFTMAAKMYKKDCQICHGKAGQGDGDKFYPKVSGQHYAYMLRQTHDIRDGVRRNANPDMVDAVKGYSDSDLTAVVDYMSRFPVKTQ